MNDEILIICADPVPLIPCPVSGAALRAWGLGQGLLGHGFKVTHAFWPKAGLKGTGLPADLITFEPETLDALLAERQPRVAVFQHWPLLLSLSKPAPCPVALDLHGPLILEMAYQQRSDYQYFLSNKVRALAKADFFTCAGYRQQHYFRAWLLAAGIDVRQGQPEVIPISLAPVVPQKRCGPELTFVFGGLFLPWQDPSAVLIELVRQMERLEKGRLQIFGGVHPSGEIPAGVYRGLMRQLQESKRVSFMGMLPREQLLGHYETAHIAVDLMEKNPERELAFTTRTVEYLWCGLPPLYNDYSDLSELIDKAGAGWIIDLDDKAKLSETIASILTSPETVEPKIKAAQKLAVECFNWERTITPLQKFCESPFRLVSDTGLVKASEDLKKYRLSLATSQTSQPEDDTIRELLVSLQQKSDEILTLGEEMERLQALETKLHGFAGYRLYKRIKRLLVERGCSES